MKFKIQNTIDFAFGICVWSLNSKNNKFRIVGTNPVVMYMMIIF